jgi:sortase (surface protein transpeptidase)
MELQPGDLIIIHDLRSTMDIRFIVEQVKVYSIQESSDPAVLTRIFGGGPKAALDGLSHLTLITCAGNIVNGQFDHHSVVYATRSK